MSEPNPQAGRPDPRWLERLEEIREDEDRGAVLPLLRWFLSGGLDEGRLVDVAETLRLLQDVRCAAPLERVVLDASAARQMRSVALQVLVSLPANGPSRERARALANDHDPLVRAYGLHFLPGLDAGLIVAGASDPDAVVRRAALDAMMSVTRTRPLVDALLRAFRDPDDGVRELACRVALFDEPVAATWGLLHCIADPCEDVRWAAYDALEDFPCVAVLLALADARGAGEDGAVAAAALDAVAAKVGRRMAEADPTSRRRLERWSGPVSWLLEEVLFGLQLEPEDDDACTGHLDAELQAATEAAQLGGEQVEAILTSDTAPHSVQRHLLVHGPWQRLGGRGLALARTASKSPQWTLREASVFALSDLDARDDLLRVARDREPFVRRAALHLLRRIGEPRAVEAAREVLADPVHRPVAGDDALEVLVALGRVDEAERALVDELSRPDDRDGLFLGAIDLVRQRRVDRAVPALLAIVNAPVVASTGPHVRALRALRELGHRRDRIDLSHLEGLDHLEVQAELGAWDWRGGRYARRPARTSRGKGPRRPVSP
jgi:HEAT repeat protein